MRNITYRVHPVSIVVVSIGLLWIILTRQADIIPRFATTQQPMPVLTVATSDGVAVQTSLQSGRATIYVLWASWCPPCRAEMPMLVALAPMLTAANVELVLVNQGEDPRVAAQWLRDQHVDLTAWYDRSGVFAQSFQAHDLPTTIFVNAAGVVDLIYRGPVTSEIITTIVSTWQRMVQP